MKSKIEDDKIYTSKSLTEINPCRGGTSTLARKDKSWSSVPDFFAKVFKKK